MNLAQTPLRCFREANSPSLDARCRFTEETRSVCLSSDTGHCRALVKPREVAPVIPPSPDVGRTWTMLLPQDSHGGRKADGYEPCRHRQSRLSEVQGEEL